MSIIGTYRLQCSGQCGGYLIWPRSDKSGPGAKAREYASWFEANRDGAEAGWFDGHNGEWAECSCRSDNGKHTMKCRLVAPRLVPLCPPCREWEENQ